MVFFLNSEKEKKEVLLMFQGVFIESNNPFIPVCQSRNLYCSCWDSVNWGKGFRTVNCDVSRKLCKSDVV